MDKRSFLFLQGAATPFFDRLAKAIRRAGIDTCRVKFCCGDALYHSDGDSVSYVGDTADLPAFYKQLFASRNISDLVLFGDTRPVHKPAIKLAKKLKLRVHVYEEGYLRPDWITMDRGGVNAYSPLPKSPTYYRETVLKVPRRVVSQKTGYSQWVRLAEDMAYNIARLGDFKYYPNYTRHRLHSPAQEYFGWFKRHSMLPFHGVYASRLVQQLIKAEAKYYVYPLQLDSDSQVRVHSPYVDGVNSATEEIIRSFATHASKDTFLIIKNHPLDTGISKYKQFAYASATEHGVRSRIRFIEAGHLPTFLGHAAGTVLINSTTGMSALFHQCPTIALGEALYDIPGLTFQGSLNDFWRRAKKPNRQLFMAFRDVVIHKTQINGNFYTRKGVAMAIKGSLKRLGIPPVPEPAPEPKVTMDGQVVTDNF